MDTPSSPPSYSESCDKGEEERGGAAPLSNSGEGVVPRDGEKEEETKRNDKLGDESSLRLKVEEKEEKEEEDGWGEEEGWGQSDWDVIIDDDIILDASSTDAKELKRVSFFILRVCDCNHLVTCSLYKVVLVIGCCNPTTCG